MPPSMHACFPNEGQWGMRSRKRLVVLVTTVGLSAAVLLLALPRPQAPRFLDELSVGVTEEAFPSYSFRCYTFETDYETVLRAMTRDLRSPEWRWTAYGIVEEKTLPKEKSESFGYWRVDRGADALCLFHGRTQRNGKPMVSWYREVPWIEQKWAAFNQWRGGR